MQRLARVGLALQGQRGYLFPWVPVFLGGGIGVFFLMKTEPDLFLIGGVAGVAAVLMAALFWMPEVWMPELWRPLVFAGALVCAGFALAGVRAHRVAGPVLEWRYYGAVEGRIVGIDRSAADAVRLTLDRVVLERMSREQTPRRVRVALHGTQGFITPTPHMTVILTAHLAPPSGPVEPGGFDFQRHAWFRDIGAVGYTRSPVLLLQAAPPTPSVFGIRMRLSAAIREALRGETGGFAAAVTTGDRSGVSQSTLNALRASNLAHLLAISGLHMGLLVGFVFATLRYGMAMSAWMTLWLPTKKIAAAGALWVAAGYLLLSGGNVATERAFVMAAVALFAVMADRRAISLRAVAMAATVILIAQPEAMLGPGFQMSFAATTALVAVFEALQARGGIEMPRWIRPVLALVVSSLVAGMATAPFGAAHFNAVVVYGLPANLLAVPLMGLVVVPSAVLALCLSPFGLELAGLVPMGWGLDAILAVAKFFAGLDGARHFVPSPPAAFLPVLALGALFLMLWRGPWRLAGLVPMVGAAALWGFAERPVALVSENGGLVGVLSAKGRSLSKARGHGFVALNWLQNDGDGADQTTAAGRLRGPEKGIWAASLGNGARVVHVQGKRAVAGFDACSMGEIVVMTHPDPRTTGPCEVITPDTLHTTGAVALYAQDGHIARTTAREVSGRRLWNTPDLRRPE